MNLPSREEMTARFWAIHNAIATTEKAVAPLREARDAAANEFRAADKAAMDGIRAIEADVIDGKSMFDAKQELSLLADILKKVGENPAA